ncbi:NAD(P)-binding protein [Cerioporus squamosus]|nr:NAD(P)-binding protein [Cerioporus squamosus]
MPTDKPTVLVLGGTGQTGRSIVDGLLKSGNFRVVAVVRPTSVTKPAAEELKAARVEIRVGSLTDDYEKLKQLLQGVDVLISAVDAQAVDQQREIFRAAKEVGVQRVVPCDFATPGTKGHRLQADVKLDVREYLKELGVGRTIIDVGWWMQFFLPLPLRSAVPPHVKEMTWAIHGSGEGRNLLTNLHHIGTFVAKIIADPRTLNKSVIVWEDEVSKQDIQKEIAEGEVAYAKNPTNFWSTLKLIWDQYMYSMHFLQENTLENAKRLGYLDARELYPDVPAQSLEECAKEFYSLPEPGITFLGGRIGVLHTTNSS